MTKLTAVIITRNKTRAKKTLQSIKFADEIIIEEHSHIDDYALVRNNAIKKARGEWVLFVDDDEIVTHDLSKEIKVALSDRSTSGYYFKRQDYFLGKQLKHGETSTVKLLRLARKSAGKFVRPVHEYWLIRGKTRTFTHPLIHYPHKSISEFLQKINYYSEIDALHRYKRGISSSLWKIALYPLGKFIKNYLLLLGFLDGIPGLIMAIMMSFHSFQTWTKLYLLQIKSHEK